MIRRIAIAVALLSLCSAPPARAGTKPWTLDDVLKVRTVTDPQVSPDAAHVAYVVSELKEDGGAYQADVWTIPTAGGEARRLTASPVADEFPRWSPDGRWLAFLSDRPRPDAKGDDPEARRQVWTIRPDGGEAVPLTSAPGGVTAFAWSHDGAFVVFLSHDPESEARRKKAMDHDDAYFPESTVVNGRLWRIDVATRRTTPLTDGTQHVSSFTIAPDDRRVCFAAQPTSRIPDLFASDLWIVPATGGAATPLVRQLGRDTNPVWSPDGRWIAFESQAGHDAEWWSNVRLCVVPAAGGKPVDLTRDFDEEVSSGPGMGGGNLVWAADSRSIVFQSLWRTGCHLFRASALDPEVTPVTHGDVVVTAASSSPDGTVLAFLRQDPTHPNDVWVLEAGATEARRLTDANPEVRDFPEFPKTVMRWKSSDGLDIDGLLVSPHAPRPGERAPLVLNIHGGPSGSHVNTFTPSKVWPWVLLLQDGWSILMPNPRGSGGYGEKFRAANVRDWGGRDYDDLMEGVNSLIRLGLVDSTRLAVNGWSYGGYMTSTIVTKTRRFRAAVVGAGVTNLTSMVGTCDIPELNQSYFRAWPWQDPQLYVDHSALFHADRVKTPTAFVHGGADDRVPPTQAYEFWNALKQNHVPTQLMILPRQPHGPYEPRLQRACAQFQYDWLTRWTLGRGVPKPAERPLPRPMPVSRPGATTPRTAAPGTTGR